MYNADRAGSLDGGVLLPLTLSGASCPWLSSVHGKVLCAPKEYYGKGESRWAEEKDPSCQVCPWRESPRVSDPLAENCPATSPLLLPRIWQSASLATEAA